MVRGLARISLHVLLMITLITASIAVPAQATRDTLQAAAATSMAAAMAEMPCGDEVPPPAHDAPCDCCDPPSCDLAACSGIACLPELPRLVSRLPAPPFTFLWKIPARTSRNAETPLRPPIA